MTAVGLLFIPLIDVTIKLQTLVNVLFLPFQCCKRNGKTLSERVRDKLPARVADLTEMNDFELLNFKQQNKFTQMIFEDLMMLTLDGLVIFGVFKVPKVTSI